MKGKKRKKIGSARPQASEKSVAKGNRCVYCGTKVDYNDPPFVVWVQSRGFPVCSKECHDKAEQYVKNDKKFKIALYGIIGACAVAILICAFLEQQGLAANLTTIGAGVGFAFFPYPITSFETFQTCSIRLITVICRVLGAILMAAGLIFMLL